MDDGKPRLKRTLERKEKVANADSLTEMIAQVEKSMVKHRAHVSTDTYVCATNSEVVYVQLFSAALLSTPTTA